MNRSIWTVNARLFLVLAICLSGFAQSGRRTQNVPVEKTKPAAKEVRQEPVPNLPPDPDAIKLDTTLVLVPVLVSDRNGLYIPDLKGSEFTIYEDGVQQEISYFATVNEPFHVVLMIDTSASTQEKLQQIRRAASAFVDQLQAADRVKVIAFDDTVRDLIPFTSDRSALRSAIATITPGQGTHLYDAFHLAMRALASVRRDRRAVVLFSDGVDNRSDAQTYDANLREVEESGVIVYPIRYETRAETEALVRGQQRHGRVPNLGDIIKRPPVGTTPPPVPGGTTIPTIPSTRPPVMDRTRTTPYPPYPGDPRDPRTRNPNDPRPPSDPGNSRHDPQQRRNDDIISATLDSMYRTADSYLNDLAQKSGGRLHRADTLLSLPDAFAKIAAELRTQYALGYYPTNAARDGGYRKIQVKTTRKHAVVRARPGYQSGSPTPSRGNQLKPQN